MTDIMRIRNQPNASFNTAFFFSLRICLLLISMLILLPLKQVQAQTYKSAEKVPNPKNTGTGYVSDAEGFLDQSHTDSLNNLLATIDQKTGVETAVVIISDFDLNDDSYEFATRLFRKWGIGKKGVDNGLLLFIVIGRRQYQFITGYGLEGLLPDAALKTIGEQTLVPAFKNQNYGNGILSTMKIISQYLQQPANHKELNTLLAKQTTESAAIPVKAFWLIGITILALIAGRQISRYKSTLPKAKKSTSNIYADVLEWTVIVLIVLIGLFAAFVVFSGNIANASVGFFAVFPAIYNLFIVVYFFLAHLNVLSHIRKSYNDDLNFTGAVLSFYKRTWWHLLLSPITVVFMVIEIWRSKKIQSRLSPLIDADGQPMNRINRDEVEKSNSYLSEGQQKEEQVGSQVYDIWTGADVQAAKLVQHPGYNFDEFDLCPQCKFRTFTKPIEIPIKAATITHQGKAKRVCICRNCKHEKFIAEVTLAMLVQPSSSSSSGSSGRSSSSSSSSSSGSWGGGRTGGGGAGGSW